MELLYDHQLLLPLPYIADCLHCRIQLCLWTIMYSGLLYKCETQQPSPEWVKFAVSLDNHACHSSKYKIQGWTVCRWLICNLADSTATEISDRLNQVNINVQDTNIEIKYPFIHNIIHEIPMTLSAPCSAIIIRTKFAVKPSKKYSDVYCACNIFLLISEGKHLCAPQLGENCMIGFHLNKNDPRISRYHRTFSDQ